MNKEVIIDKLIEQIKQDIEQGDTTVLAELLGFIPGVKLLQGLPEEKWYDEDNKINLFEHYKLLPENVQVILGKFDNDEVSYKTLDKLIAELNQVGWTCKYGLACEPFDLKRLK